MRARGIIVKYPQTSEHLFSPSSVLHRNKTDLGKKYGYRYRLIQWWITKRWRLTEIMQTVVGLWPDVFCSNRARLHTVRKSNQRRFWTRRRFLTKWTNWGINRCIDRYWGNGPLKIRQKETFYMEKVYIPEHYKNSYKTPIIMITSPVRYCRWNLSKQYYSFLISFYQFRHECLSRRNNSLHISCHLWFYSKVLQKISVRIWLRLWRASKVWSQPPHLWLHLWRASKVKLKLPAYLTTPLTSFKGIAKRWRIWLHLWQA